MAASAQQPNGSHRSRLDPAVILTVAWCGVVYLSVHRSFLGQVLCIPLAIAICLYCMRQTTRTWLAVKLISLAWIITAASPVDLAIRNGENAAVRVARVVNGVSAVRLSQENPGKAYVAYPGNVTPVQPSWAIVVVIPTERRIVTPIFRLPAVPFFLGPRQNRDEGLGDW